MDRLSDLRRLHKHLIAAHQLARQLGLSDQARIFPLTVCRQLAAEILADAEMLAAAPPCAPVPAHDPVPSHEAPAPNDDTKRLTDARPDRDQT